MPGQVVGEGTIVIDADLSAYEAAMGNAPTAAVTAATGASGAFSGEFKKISNAAAAMSRQVGGEFGQIGTVANRILRPLAEVSGGLAAVGASAAAVGLVAEATYHLAESAVSAADRLHKLGIEVSPEQQANVQSYKAATKDLGIAFDELEVAVGGELAGDLSTVASAAAGALRAFSDLKDFVSQDREEIELFARAGLAIATLGLTEAARAGLDYAAASNRAEVNTKALTAAEQDKIDKEKMEKEAQEDIAAGTWEMARLRLQEAAAAKVQAAADKIASENAAEARAEMLAQNEREQAESAKLQGTHWLHLADLFGKANAQMESDAHDLTITKAVQDKLQERSDDEKTAKEIRNALQVSASIGQMAADIAGDYASVESSIIDGYQARIDAGERLTKAQVQQANHAIDAAEGAALASAGISATVTAISGIASLQSMGIPPFVAIPLGIAEGAGAFAAAASGIVSHRPMSFSWHDGPTWHNSDPPDAGHNVSSAGANQAIDTKGGDSSLIHGDDSGGAVRHSGSSEQRGRAGGVQVRVKVESSRPGKLPRRGGRA